MNARTPSTGRAICALLLCTTGLVGGPLLVGAQTGRGNNARVAVRIVIERVEEPPEQPGMPEFVVQPPQVTVSGLSGLSRESPVLVRSVAASPLQLECAVLGPDVMLLGDRSLHTWTRVEPETVTLAPRRTERLTLHLSFPQGDEPLYFGVLRIRATDAEGRPAGEARVPILARNASLPVSAITCLGLDFSRQGDRHLIRCHYYFPGARSGVSAYAELTAASGDTEYQVPLQVVDVRTAELLSVEGELPLDRMEIGPYRLRLVLERGDRVLHEQNLALGIMLRGNEKIIEISEPVGQPAAPVRPQPR